MEKIVRNFKNFDKVDESLFSGEQEEYITSNDTMFGKEEEEEITFDENELTSDNDMLDSNDDKIDDEIQQSDVKKPSGFNPNISMTPQDWSIIKFMSDGGIRLGMGYSNELDQDVEVLGSNLDYQSCVDKLTQMSSELNIPQFNNSVENYLGGMHKSMVVKPSQKTSYGG